MVKRLSKFFPKLKVAGVLVDARNSMEMNKSAFN
jgi:hypothetical protein